MLIKGLIGIFALKAIQKCEAGFKTQSYEKASFSGLWLPGFDFQIFRNAALKLRYLRLCMKNSLHQFVLIIQNSLAPIGLDDSKFACTNLSWWFKVRLHQFVLMIQNSLAPICLDYSKLSPRQSTHKHNLNRLLTPLVLNKIQKLRNEYLYRTQGWLKDLHKSSPKIWSNIWGKNIFQ